MQPAYDGPKRINETSKDNQPVAAQNGQNKKN